jgi:hypothetical protein
MEHREPSTRSHADCDPSFRLPVPPQPLKDHPHLPVETIVQQMEALLALEALMLKKRRELLDEAEAGKWSIDLPPIERLREDRKL